MDPDIVSRSDNTAGNLVAIVPNNTNLPDKISTGRAERAFHVDYYDSYNNQGMAVFAKNNGQGIATQDPTVGDLFDARASHLTGNFAVTTPAQPLTNRKSLNVYVLEQMYFAFKQPMLQIIRSGIGNPFGCNWLFTGGHRKYCLPVGC